MGILLISSLISLAYPIKVISPPKSPFPVSTTSPYLIPKNTDDIVTIIKRVAVARRFDVAGLLALADMETSLGRQRHVISDSGCSMGVFQINTCVYPETKIFIGNIYRETHWVVDKLLEYDYKKDIKRAMARYNAPYRPNFVYASLVMKMLEKYR